MAFGIGITAPGETGWRLREYWSKFGRFERAPSMVALDHPPHVTLAVYDSIPERQLSEVLRSVFGVHPPLRLQFNKLAFSKRQSSYSGRLRSSRNISCMLTRQHTSL
jgi:2'-5' RNA ligase